MFYVKKKKVFLPGNFEEVFYNEHRDRRTNLFVPPAVELRLYSAINSCRIVSSTRFK